MNPELNKLSDYRPGGRILLRDINYIGYPEVTDNKTFAFCREQFFCCTPNQLELLSDFRVAIINQTGFWRILNSEDEDLGENEVDFHRAKIKQISIIEQSLVVRVDMDGDEYYSEPHVYLDIPDPVGWFSPFKSLRNANDELLDPAKRLW